MTDDGRAQHDPAAGFPLLGFTAWAILCEPTDAATPASVGAHVPAHLEWLGGLEQAGVVVLSGPLVSGPGTGPGSGLIVVRAASEAAAQELAAQDPIVRAGLRRVSVFQWRINEGSLDVRLVLSRREVEWR